MTDASPCACVAADATACADKRYGRFLVGSPDYAESEPCECTCHDGEQEDDQP